MNTNPLISKSFQLNPAKITESTFYVANTMNNHSIYSSQKNFGKNLQEIGLTLHHKKKEKIRKSKFLIFFVFFEKEIREN